MAKTQYVACSSVLISYKRMKSATCGSNNMAWQTATGGGAMASINGVSMYVK